MCFLPCFIPSFPSVILFQIHLCRCSAAAALPTPLFVSPHRLFPLPPCRLSPAPAPHRPPTVCQLSPAACRPVLSMPGATVWQQALFFPLSPFPSHHVAAFSHSRHLCILTSSLCCDSPTIRHAATCDRVKHCRLYSRILPYPSSANSNKKATAQSHCSSGVDHPPAKLATSPPPTFAVSARQLT